MSGRERRFTLVPGLGGFRSAPEPETRSDALPEADTVRAAEKLGHGLLVAATAARAGASPLEDRLASERLMWREAFGDRLDDDTVWLALLTERVGAVAKEIASSQLQAAGRRPEHRREAIEQAVAVAAVAMTMAEVLSRRDWGEIA